MSPISLSASETKSRFGVQKDIALFPENLTKQEEENVKVVLEYMEVRISLLCLSVLCRAVWRHILGALSPPPLGPYSFAPIPFLRSSLRLSPLTTDFSASHLHRR